MGAKVKGKGHKMTFDEMYSQQLLLYVIWTFSCYFATI